MQRGTKIFSTSLYLFCLESPGSAVTMDKKHLYIRMKLCKSYLDTAAMRNG